MSASLDSLPWEDRPYVIMVGDNVESLRKLPSNSIDAVVTDAPYGLSKEPDMLEVLRHWLSDERYKHKSHGFMGKSWDSFVPGPEVWKEVIRVLKPGGHAISFFGTRTYDMGVLAMRIAGFEVRDQIAWVYGCLDERTEVATMDGVKPHHEVGVGDYVLCYDVASGSYSYQPVLEVVSYDYADTAYRLIGDFGEQVVSRNHRCIVERDGVEVFVLAEEAARKQQARVPVLESLSELRQVLSGPQVIRAWGGHKAVVVRIEPFRYVGKMWCLRVPTGAFVAVRDGVAFPTGNSGFPKSLDVSKAIGKAAGAEREVVGVSANDRPQSQVKGGKAFDRAMDKGQEHATIQITAPATPEAKQWEGWGTALKPSMEPIVLARKPIEGTVAANVLKHGCGGINVDGCRVGMSESDRERIDGMGGFGAEGWVNTTSPAYNTNCPFNPLPRTKAQAHNAGRWPANLIHDGSEEVVGLFPAQAGAAAPSSGPTAGKLGSNGILNGAKGDGWDDGSKSSFFGDSGSAARFFYCPKASKRDRDEGLDGFSSTRRSTEYGSMRKKRCKVCGTKSAESGAGGRWPNCDHNDWEWVEQEEVGHKGGNVRNHHPTVKPTALMRYLVRMVTPPGGVVLDHFMGSGSTGKAAMLEGFRFIGMDIGEDYAEIAKARIEHALATRESQEDDILGLFGDD